MARVAVRIFFTSLLLLVDDEDSSWLLRVRVPIGLLPEF